MEKVMTPEERIKRAEEIYYRRQAQGVRVSSSSVNVGSKNKISLGRKMIIQIIICLVIYCAFCNFKKYDNAFSNNVIAQTKVFLEYDINLGKLYNQCMEYFNTKFNNNIGNKLNENNINDEQNTENIIENNIQENIEINEVQEQEVTTEEIQENINEEQPGIGGGSENISNIELQDKSQMEIDAEYVKQNVNICIPVNGYITSGFGDREPTEIISSFHQGIDIGAVTGTPIKAAMDGTVVASSYAGDYGNHIKIQNGEVLTVYAHCSELEVAVGDYIKQGQEIAKVGATRKSNRSTFTF